MLAHGRTYDKTYRQDNNISKIGHANNTSYILISLLRKTYITIYIIRIMHCYCCDQSNANPLTLDCYVAPQVLSYRLCRLCTNKVSKFIEDRRYMKGLERTRVRKVRETVAAR